MVFSFCRNVESKDQFLKLKGTIFILDRSDKTKLRNYELPLSLIELGNKTVYFF